MQRKVKKDLSAVNSQLSLELEVHQTAKQNLKKILKQNEHVQR